MSYSDGSARPCRITARGIWKKFQSFLELIKERPLHRPKEWRKDEREQEKVSKKNDWYKQGGKEAVIFVPATPNSQLQRKYQKEIKRQGFKIKVVEKAGIAIKRLLQRSDPCKPRQCEREDCLVCRTDGKGPCDRQSVTYEIKYTECNNIYWEKHQEARIPEGRNTRSHLTIRKSDRPYGNIVRRNITMKCRDFK